LFFLTQEKDLSELFNVALDRRGVVFLGGSFISPCVITIKIIIFFFRDDAIFLLVFDMIGEGGGLSSVTNRDTGGQGGD